MTVANVWELFIPLRVLDGLAVAAVWPAVMALISERVRPRDKAMALAALDLETRPDVLQAARAEFEEKTKGQKYVSPLPEGAVPH